MDEETPKLGPTTRLRLGTAWCGCHRCSNGKNAMPIEARLSDRNTASPFHHTEYAECSPRHIVRQEIRQDGVLEVSPGSIA